jgi:hypothetical protein
LETREGKTEGRRVEKEVEVERVPLMEMGMVFCNASGQGFTICQDWHCERE